MHGLGLEYWNSDQRSKQRSKQQQNRQQVSMDRLHIITTGGTIDKVYFDALSDYQIGDPVIGDLLIGLKVSFAYSVEPLMRKDSLELDDSDRDQIAAAVKGNDAPYVLITHGTDTMTKTAEALATIGNKTIVLTGALQPAAFKQSDALFNIGCAIGAVQSKEHGVYIAMNGSVFAAGEVRKNRDAGRFEAL